MSLVWERSTADRQYQVRRAGRSIRLYTNGVFHSQYNPQRPVSGNVWDLLFIPAFFYPPGSIQRVLILGVGGGAVIQQLRRFVQPSRIIGVELSSVHLFVARRFFGVRGADVQLVHADAREWLQRYRGPAFDMIIDDLFTDQNGEPERAISADSQWAASLHDRLSGAGMIVSNFATFRELTRSAYVLDNRCRNSFASGFRLYTPQNQNAVGVFLRSPADTGQLRERLCGIPALNPRRKRGALRYGIQTLFQTSTA